jgi:hypothetical protein
LSMRFSFARWTPPNLEHFLDPQSPYRRHVTARLPKLNRGSGKNQTEPLSLPLKK